MLDNEQFTFSTEDLPALIHAEKGTGAGRFSLALLIQLFFQGEPLLIVSSGTDVKDAFIEQTHAEDKLGTITSLEDIKEQSYKQVLFILNEQQDLLPEVIRSLEDFSERVVLLTKFEGFSKESLALFYGHPKTIYTVDLNTSEAKEPLLQLKYMTKIFFSPLYNDFRLNLPPLEQYHGYYQGRTATGTVSLLESE